MFGISCYKSCKETSTQQLSVDNYKSSASITNHPSSLINRQPSIATHQSPIIIKLLITITKLLSTFAGKPFRQVLITAELYEKLF